MLGATGGVVANAIQKRAKQTDPIQALPAPEQEVKLLAEAVPEVKPLTQPTIRKGVELEPTAQQANPSTSWTEQQNR